MQGKVFINGRIVDPQDATISIFDRGFLYGDSVFETMRVYHGVPFALDEHLERLAASGVRVNFTLPWDNAVLKDAIAKTLKAGDLLDAYLRIITTRGTGAMGLDPALARDPTLIVIVTPLPALPERMYTEGRTACIVSQTRHGEGAVDPRAKTGNYLGSVLASQQATSRGAQEAIMTDGQGRVAEASSANIFVLLGGVWCTPPLDVGILGGITRSTLLKLCKQADIPCEERVLYPRDLERAQEMFLCASVREVVPVVQLDGKPVGEGKVGGRTMRMRELYGEEVAKQIAMHRT